MSQRDQHLTTEQLSALLDQQLTPEEQAYCNAHREECEQCQTMLDNLQQTVSLLRSLPQLEVPRSFALPTAFKITSDGNKQVEQSTAKPTRRPPTPLRRTLRAVSALAAVIGLFFTLSSFVVQFHPDATGTSSMSAPTTAKFPTSSQYQQAPQVKSNNSNEGNLNTSNKADNKQQSPPAETNSTATRSTLPFLDFNQSGERLFIGIPLTILGTIGFISCAQRQKHRTRAVKRNS